MAVSNPNVVDAIGIDRLSGRVMMTMTEERDWSAPEVCLKDLESKVNSYLDFVLGGQFNETPEYVGKPVAFLLFLQFSPPDAVKPHFRALASQLTAMNIEFLAFIGPHMWSPRFEWET